MSAQPDSAPGMKASRTPEANEAQMNGVKANGAQANGAHPIPAGPDERKKIVVVGLGMVGVAFMSVPTTALSMFFQLTASVTERNYSSSTLSEENTISSLLAKRRI